ncbi:hypothetical protein RLEG3_27865 [Rhizobium leguminosarum bv. trifolii WSM1689]|uniref:SDR family NAD(P)-dependent oxidoreductase n=1 Tax=Rhizobium TaxID=379 RepID=UPI0003E0872A|nr:hypothetical protein RLEG3_27865 [Rhizobium leguminosarum bv. trifolii WSM1689]
MSSFSQPIDKDGSTGGSFFDEEISGVIVNVSSGVTIKPLPALSVYSASKAALNAFTESLALKAGLFDVRAKLVLPGSASTTGFGKNASPGWA